ncbi:calcium-binding protein, partial [Methylobacterium segetis]|uniref:calcium-binding protein n=1 Tax=Methylobacterium segetis TaxID=2488750 RepID=UPI0010436A27
PVSRFDDEGISFVSATPGLTFDVRDLVSGVQRGDRFEVVTLGTSESDTITALDPARPTYINAGQGNDIVTGGTANDFLVGGAGNDTLSGLDGNDSFIGGAGTDTIFGGAGNDTAIFNVSTDGSDAIDLGAGDDIVNVSAASAGQIRLTFTSAEVGNNNPNDASTGTNQDGGLAVRLQAEDAAGALAGLVSRFDDEGITFVAAAGTTFDVRDLVSGVQRGDAFEVVTLGTQADDILTAVQGSRSYYINGGQGNDTITGGTANDFLVGGAGNDTLSGLDGNDSFIGGAGTDTIFGGAGNDTAIFNVSTDGSDAIDLGAGDDIVNVSAASAGQIRLTFTSAEVGNNNPNDASTGTNQDGGLAVRLQAEDAAGALAGLVSRFDDEGITFVAAAGTTFDVRDLVSGVQRGDAFEVVTLGTQADDILTAVQGSRSYYINGGQGNDTITGGTANDFLVGGAGNDTLSGLDGNDSFIGGAGTDTIFGGAGNDTAIFNVSTDGSDAIDLGAGDDIVNVSAASAGQIRLTFTSAEVGNNNPNDASTGTNQDGGLAVRLQAE